MVNLRNRYAFSGYISSGCVVCNVTMVGDWGSGIVCHCGLNGGSVGMECGGMLEICVGFYPESKIVTGVHALLSSFMSASL